MFRFVKRFLAKSAPGKPPPLEADELEAQFRQRSWRERFEIQDRYSFEGVAASNAGLPASANPYDRDANGEGWNFWLYGWQNCEGEKQIFAHGGFNIYSTSSIAPLGWVSLKDSAAAGRPWKPKFAITPKSSD